jgi:DNA modification methylase
MDPFAGTGSTLVAAEAMRRNWIGVEKDELTTRFAATRLKD